MRCIFVELQTTPTKVTRIEAMSAKSNPVSGKDFNSLTGLSEMKIVNPYVSVSKAVSENPVSQHFTQEKEAKSLTGCWHCI
jgi:hypothetical protein